MNRFKVVFTVFFQILFVVTYGQEWHEEWYKQYGNSKMDYFADVISDMNGGYTVLGATKPENKSNYDFWMIRFNENGDSVRSQTFGTGFNDIAKKIIQDADGNYIMLGISKDSVSDKVLLIKTDKNGKELWKKILNDENYYVGEDIVSGGDNGFMLVGSKSNEKNKRKRWFAKFDTEGKMVWERNFLDEHAGFCKAVKHLPIGGYVIAGQIEKTGEKSCDSWITRLNENGEYLWGSKIASANLKTWPECVCCSPDSFLMVIGWQGLCLNDINSENAVFDFDLSVSKLDKTGKLVWTKNIKREGNEGGNSVVIRPDGKFVIGGVKQTSFSGKIGPWLLLVDGNGKEISEKVMRFHCSNDQAVKVINTNDGGIVVVGPGVQEESNIRSNGWIAKFNGL